MERKIRLSFDEDYDVLRENNKWTAAIQGPWYDDSCPRGEGCTKEEAESQAVEELREWKKAIDEFLDKQGARYALPPSRT